MLSGELLYEFSTRSIDNACWMNSLPILGPFEILICTRQVASFSRTFNLRPLATTDVVHVILPRQYKVPLLHATIYAVHLFTRPTITPC